MSNQGDAPPDDPQEQDPQEQEEEVEIFSLAPGRSRSSEVIDYSTETGRKIYKGATEPLKKDHDLSAGNLRDFLNLLDQRAMIYDWNDVLEIPAEEANKFTHLLKQYGSISLKKVRENAASYVNGKSRAAQDSQQLAQCILNSLTVEARNSVTLWDTDYTIGGMVSGTCLLKVVIRESHIDTNATTRIIREELTKLDAYMVSIDSDIPKFNEHVKDLLTRLHARGAMTFDLLANLFKAYKSASDKEFVKYINHKKNDYDEGNDISPDRLMLLAANRYKTMKQDQEWNAPSVEQEQIIALKAQVDKLKISKANKDKKDTSTKEKTGGKPYAKKDQQFKKRKPRPAWMFVAPKQGQAEKKTVDGKEYHWCKKHEAWGRHLPSKCEGKGWIPGKRKTTDKKVTWGSDANDNDSQVPPSKKLKIAQALSSILDDDSE